MHIVRESETKYSSLAQSVEHAAVNRSVVGSSPTGGAKEPPNQVVLFCTKELMHGLLDLIYLIMNNSIAPISM